MINQLLRKKIEASFGKPIRYSQKCEALSESIFEVTGVRLSTTTLKRLLGFTTMKVSPRASTLDILAKYVGEATDEEIVSAFSFSNGISSDEICEGTKIRISYNPGRVIEMQYLGRHLYHIFNAIGSKLCKGDTVKIDSMSIGLEFIASQVFRDGKNLGSYFAAKDGGLVSINIIK